MDTDPHPFVRSLLQEAAFSEAATALWSGQPISVEGVAGGSCALAAAALMQQGYGSMILVAPNVDSAEQIAEDMVLFEH
jgi:hypothetical protein